VRITVHKWKGKWMET